MLWGKVHGMHARQRIDHCHYVCGCHIWPVYTPIRKRYIRKKHRVAQRSRNNSFLRIPGNAARYSVGTRSLQWMIMLLWCLIIPFDMQEKSFPFCILDVYFVLQVVHWGLFIFGQWWTTLYTWHPCRHQGTNKQYYLGFSGIPALDLLQEVMQVTWENVCFTHVNQVEHFVIFRHHSSKFTILILAVFHEHLQTLLFSWLMMIMICQYLRSLPNIGECSWFKSSGQTFLPMKLCNLCKCYCQKLKSLV